MASDGNCSFAPPYLARQCRRCSVGNGVKTLPLIGRFVGGVEDCSSNHAQLLWWKNPRGKQEGHGGFRQVRASRRITTLRPVGMCISWGESGYKLPKEKKTKPALPATEP